jgi:hypothetical protein
MIINWLAVGAASAIGGGVPLLLEMVLYGFAVPTRFHTVLRVPVFALGVALAWTYAWDVADFIRQQRWS